MPRFLGVFTAASLTVVKPLVRQDSTDIGGAPSAKPRTWPMSTVGGNCSLPLAIQRSSVARPIPACAHTSGVDRYLMGGTFSYFARGFNA